MTDKKDCRVNGNSPNPAACFPVPQTDNRRNFTWPENFLMKKHFKQDKMQTTKNKIRDVLWIILPHFRLPD